MDRMTSANSSSLTPVELSQLRALLNEHLQANNVYNKIKDAVITFMQKRNADPAFGNNDCFDFTDPLQQASLAQIMLDFLSRNSHTGPVKPPNGKCLVVKLISGDQFYEAEEGNFIIAVVIFGSNRICTYPIPSQSSPVFNQEFIFELEQTFGQWNQLSFHQLLHCQDKLKIVLLKENSRTRFREIVSSQEVEWRGTLETGSDELCVEFFGHEDGAPRMSIGILKIQLRILLRLDQSRSNYCDPTVISKYLSDKWHEKNETSRKFRTFIKSWWAEFLSIRSDHEQRIIKIFVFNESNEKCFVCSLVHPLVENRVIPSPAHAARFVRMIPNISDISVGGETTASWTTLPVFLSRGHGSTEDHCVLLCSLLLGFGLNAYICCGKNRDNAYTWVMTVDNKNKILFWDSANGTTHSLERAKEDAFERKKFPFQTIGCAFNHKEYFANIQNDDAVLSTSWDLSNANLWKGIPSELIQMCILHNPTRILPCTIEPVGASERLDAELKRQVEQYRGQHLNADTVWDDALACCLTQALAAYEYQFISGTTFGNLLFQQAIKHVVPLHYVFKAYPAQFDHTNPHKIMSHFIQEPIPAQMVNMAGKSLSFAVRSYIVPYAEQVAATWVMIAIKWRQ